MAVCCVSGQFTVYNYALYCKLLAPAFCPQRPSYISVKKEQFSTVQNCTWSTHTKEEWQGRYQWQSVSCAGSEHFGRPVTTHMQSPLSFYTLQRDRTVAGHKEKGHYQKTLYLPPRIARTPSTNQPEVNCWLIYLQAPWQPRIYNCSQRWLAISGEDDWQSCLLALLSPQRMLLEKFSCFPYVRRSIRERFLYWHMHLQDTHCPAQAPPSSPPSHSCIHTYSHTHQGLRTWPWSNTDSPPCCKHIESLLWANHAFTDKIGR